VSPHGRVIPKAERLGRTTLFFKRFVQEHFDICLVGESFPGREFLRFGHFTSRHDPDFAAALGIENG
jgi:hypothetical protein